MSGKSFVCVAALAAVTGLAVSTAWAQITIPTVPIGNPGNAADAPTGFGSVAYTYNIGTTEVTNAQYAAFLNAKAADDPLNLYSSGMSGPVGGIARSGSPGSYTYSTVPGRENNPVSFVSFWDAARFVNWLQNGQGNADTETGAYTLTPDTIASNTVVRNAGWQWALPSVDEWYKAAFHQPADQGGDVDSFWRYTTMSNDAPTFAQVNYEGAINNTTPVGSYAPNFYGTFDMGGNVSEWTDTRSTSNRRIAGGSFASNVNDIGRTGLTVQNATFGPATTGFRLVQIPGPGSAALLVIGGLAAARRRRTGGR
jgi:formylglycine-generating enzyme